MSTPRTMARLLGSVAPLGVLLLIGAAFAMAPGSPPLSGADLRLIALHTVIVATAGFGMTLVIISGGLDLSVGSMLALSSVTAALAARAGWSPLLIVCVAIGTGAVCGLYNAVLIAALRLPAFIATLGTLGFFRGVAKWLADSGTVRAPTAGLEWLMAATPTPAWLVLAPGVWLMVFLGLGMACLISRTVLGRHAVSIGSNEQAARYAAVPIPRRRAQVYVIAGLLTGLAGVMQFSRLTVGDSTVAVGLELEVIAACVIGGASLRGGSGSVLGTMSGAMLMALLKNRCAALGWPNFVQEMLVGHIIIAAVAIDSLRRRPGGPTS